MQGSSIRPIGVGLALVVAIAVVSLGAHAKTIVAPPAELTEGSSWTVLKFAGDAALPALGTHWEGSVFWDLRPVKGTDRFVRWSVVRPVDVGLSATAAAVGADRALCAEEESDGTRIGCRLFRHDRIASTGPRILWSDLPGEPAGVRRWKSQPGTHEPLEVGASFREVAEVEGRGMRFEAQVVAEGLALLPAGPREVVLVRERVDDERGALLRYRFVTTSGRTAAELRGSVPAPGVPFRMIEGELLASDDTRADDGLRIAYQSLSDALVPGQTGFLQWSTVVDTPLSSLVSTWAGVPEMISIDQAGVAYQPDPGDPGSSVTLPEVWDFSGLQTGILDYRVFNTTRDDNTWSTCLETCAVRDLGPNPPDGTWQAILKIDNWAPDGSLFTEDIFTLNDNDTGANPSIDVPFVSQDVLNTSDRTAICFDDSAGGAWRFLRFFQFFGPDPANSFLGVGDAWSSGDWTSCSNTNGLRLTLASVCDNACYPDCPGSFAAPRARGLLSPVPPLEPADNEPGLGAVIVEDGYVHVAPGNYVPALLMRQDTDIQAGADLFGTCNLSTQRQRSFDYFWVQERYGLLALVSAPSDDTGTLPPDDWSQFGNITDGADFTWGPYPPYQTEAQACLSGTRVSWALPADGSNLNDTACNVTLPDTTVVPCIQDYGYVVAWGNDSDPEVLADWATNPNHTPLPGEGGYLAAPSGSEPTSTVITGWPGSSINATVVTALNYTDPDAKDEVAYRSAAFYKVTEDPATLNPATFQVGTGVEPFVTLSGNDLTLAWPAVAGASSYSLKVFDLDTKLEIACPAGMDCGPAGTTATHPGGASGGNFGYRAFAVDPCGELSPN